MIAQDDVVDDDSNNENSFSAEEAAILNGTDEQVFHQRPQQTQRFVTVTGVNNNMPEQLQQQQLVLAANATPSLSVSSEDVAEASLCIRTMADMHRQFVTARGLNQDVPLSERQAVVQEETTLAAHFTLSIADVYRYICTPRNANTTS